MNLRFNHNEDQMHKAFNVSDDTRRFVMHNIVFETINTYLQVYSLYDKWEDAPLQLMGNSVLIERIADRLDKPEDLMYMLYIFGKARNDLEAMVEHIMTSGASKELAEDAIKALEGKIDNEHAEAIRQVVSKLKLIPVRKIFSDVKKANGLFESYWSTIENNGYDTTIDDLLNGALKNSDHNED